MDPNGKVSLLRDQKGSKDLPLSTVADLLGISRTSIYRKPRQPDEQEITAKRFIDELHTAHPTWGSRQLSKQLKGNGIPVGRLKTRNYMNEMGITAIYPKPNLSKAAKGHKIYPYLLRNAVISRPNQAWSIDITYIRLNHGFVYLTAIIDWYSRCIVGWEIDDTLSTTMVLRAMDKALEVAKPLILNSDQGSQFTGHEYVEFLKQEKIQISMDGKSRWADNIMIERWFRTLKYEEVYLKNYRNIKEARKEIGSFIDNYNFNRLHSSLDYRTPGSLYYPLLLERTA